MRLLQRTAILRRPFVLAMAAALVVGCNDGVSPESELALAKSRWERSMPPVYSFDLSFACFCGGPSRVTLTVASGVLVEIHNTSTGEVIPVSSGWLELTVDGLFSLIDEAIRERNDWIDAKYNPTFGFPVEIHIDQSFGWADDEFSYFVTNFRPLGTR